MSQAERAEVLHILDSERFIDQPPREVYATLLEEGRFLCSIRTMYRLLRERGELRERRDHRERGQHAIPRLVATAPNQVWTWDISKLATFVSGVFLNLYVILDLFSRYVVAWMVAERENSALAQQLFAEAISRYGIEPGKLIVHQDRGAPMTAHGSPSCSLRSVSTEVTRGLAFRTTTRIRSRSFTPRSISPTTPAVFAMRGTGATGATTSSAGTTTTTITRG